MILQNILNQRHCSTKHFSNAVTKIAQTPKPSLQCTIRKSAENSFTGNFQHKINKKEKKKKMASINIDNDMYFIDMVYRYFSVERYSSIRKAILSEALFYFEGRKINIDRKDMLKLFYKTSKRLNPKMLEKYKLDRKTFDKEIEDLQELSKKMSELKVEPVPYKHGFLLADGTVVEKEPDDRPSHEVEITKDGTLREPTRYKRCVTEITSLDIRMPDIK